MEIGIIKENNNGSKFKVIEKDIIKSDSKHTYYKIKFLESGYEDSVRSDSINRGLVKDNLSKSCCGVGSIGYVNTRSNWHEYKIWNNIINRCYNVNDKSYQFYGAQGVIVCDRWLIFENFLNDIKFIPGFNQELFNQGKLRLDKDIISNSKIYSPQTTIWVSDYMNQIKRTLDYNLKNKRFVIFPDGHIEQILNLSDFCRNNNLYRSDVYDCLNNKREEINGYRFYKE